MREFYGDPDRAASNEIDFGSSWRTQGNGPWKVIWLESTGELAAFDQSADEVVVVGYAVDLEEQCDDEGVLDNEDSEGEGLT